MEEAGAIGGLSAGVTSEFTGGQAASGTHQRTLVAALGNVATQETAHGHQTQRTPS